MLLWDGSHLGDFKTNIITRRIKFMNMTYLLLKLNINFDFVILCRAKKVQDKFSCIIDEIKPIFGVEKMGSHSIKIAKSLFVIYKTEWNIKNDDIEIKIGEPLHKIPKSDLIRLTAEFEIKCMLAFRDLVGLDCFESLILIDTNTKKMITLKEHQSKGSSALIIDSFSNISTVSNRNWFPKNDLKFYVNYMVDNVVSIDGSNFQYKDLIETFMRVHNFVYDVAVRIEKKNIWIVNYVTTRLRTHLSE